MNRIVVFGCLFLSIIAAPAIAQSPAQRIRGDVIALDGSTLRIKSESGQIITVTVAKDARVSARSRASLDNIAPGVFLGTTAVPRADGTLVATEVHVFPESMRGTGEGHRPMDGPPGSTMTNATVAAVKGSASDAPPKPRSTMTNATVTDVSGVDRSRRMTLKYKDGEKVVVVPEGVPVVMVEPGELSMLAPGAHVVVTATRSPDGAMTADRISVGKDGLVPPI